MAAYPFGAFIQHDSTPIEIAPGLAKVVLKDVITVATPTEFELNDLQWGTRLNGPRDEPEEPTPGELEQSQPPTPKQDLTVDAIVQSASSPVMNRWRLAAAGVMFFLMGCNDGVTGAIIPYVELEYKIGYAVVSLVFVANAVGFISAAPIVQTIDAKWGRSRAYVVATTMMSLGYIALVCAPPFPVVVIAFYFLGFGLAVFLSITNAFIVNLLNGTVILGFMHGLYGVGGIVSPLIATAMVSHGIRWSFFYLIPLSMAVVSIAFMGWSYKDFEKDASVQLLSALQRTASRQASALGEPTKLQLLGRSFQNRTTLLGALFIFFYQGAEVAISGWVISYLIHYRNGSPAQVGNVTSGFWAGITVGRFVLTHFAHKMGEKTAIVGLIIGAAAFQSLVWAVPNIIGNAVAESIVGLFLGPVYPCATAVFSKLLPRNIQISSLSIVTSMGSSGGALVPFLTGLLSQSLGTVVLHPIVLVSFAAMMGAWLLLPKIGKRAE